MPGISTIMWGLVGVFASLTPLATGYYGVHKKSVVYEFMDFISPAFIGFIGGSLSSLLGCGLLYTGERYITIHPNSVFKNSLAEINKNELIRSYAGGAVTCGALRAFRQEGGKWTILNHKLVWKKPHVQMIYNVFGPARQELYIAVDAAKNGYTEEITFIGAYAKGGALPSSSSAKFIVKGEAEGFTVADELNAFVTFQSNFGK